MQKFLESSSIHGVQYIFVARNSKWIRLLWIFILLSSFCGLGYYIKCAYTKLSIEPDISLTTRERNIKEFPFPAVTICPQIFASADKAVAEKFFDTRLDPKNYNYTKSECLYAAANSQWCSQPSDIEMLKSRCEEHSTEMDEINVTKIIEESTAKLYISNFESLTKVIATAGVCYTYNLQDFNTIFTDEIHDDFREYFQSPVKSIEWTPERGYINKSSNFPQRLHAGTGYTYGIRINKSDADNACLANKIYLHFHSPNEISATTSGYYQEVYLNHYEIQTIRVNVKSIRSEMDLKQLSLDLRKCYFEGEKKLKYFKVYTLSHCKFECTSNLTLAKFGCVLFHYPRDANTKVCTLSELHTYKKMSGFDPNMDECKCLSLCNEVKYVIEAEKIPIQNYASNDQRRKVLAFSSFSLYFSDETIEEVEKFLGYKLQNFISDIGGLLGLFLGCSLISIAEIIFLVVQGFLEKSQIFQKKSKDSTKSEFEELKLKVKRIEGELREIKSIQIKFGTEINSYGELVDVQSLN